MKKTFSIDQSFTVEITEKPIDDMLSQHSHTYSPPEFGRELQAQYRRMLAVIQKHPTFLQKVCIYRVLEAMDEGRSREEYLEDYFDDLKEEDGSVFFTSLLAKHIDLFSESERSLIQECIEEQDILFALGDHDPLKDCFHVTFGYYHIIEHQHDGVHSQVSDRSNKMM